MNVKEFEALEIGDCLRFSDGVLGRVVSFGFSSLFAVWDDGQEGWIHKDDCAVIEKAVNLEGVGA